jgi:CHAT domain-containing protein
LYWYPSGDFALLPLHAAGIYNTSSNEAVSDFVVSSYAPSLSSILTARDGFDSINRGELKMLIIAEPDAPGFASLSNVEEEAIVVAGLAASVSAQILNDIDDAPVVDEVSNILPSTTILHVSCHGVQHQDPLQSQFALRDGPLTISKLMKLKLPSAMLAFLSACETAKGDVNQPDQAVHLAASLLFCGFRSVVATMWSVTAAQ